MSEYKTIVNCTKPLEVALGSVERDIVHFLHQKEFITVEVHDDVLNPRCMLTDHQKAGQLVTGIRKAVNRSAKNYHFLVSHLRHRGGKYEPIADILDSEYNRQEQARKIESDKVIDNVKLNYRYSKDSTQEAKIDGSDRNTKTDQEYSRSSNRLQQEARHLKRFIFLAGGGVTLLLLIGYGLIYTYLDSREVSRKNNGGNVRNNSQYKDCKHAYVMGQKTSGVYTVKPDDKMAFQVYCDMTTDGGGWTVFQRRVDGSLDFFRDWIDYEEGFGNLTGEHWLGLQKIHRLSASAAQQLRVDLGDHDNNNCSAYYDSFKVAGPNEKYRLEVAGFSGAAGNSLGWHTGMQFTTKDQDNDIHRNVNCASIHRGAWWYARCHDSNLNGYYYQSGGHGSYADGVNWYDWKGYNYSLKFTEMKMRTRAVIKE